MNTKVEGQLEWFKVRTRGFRVKTRIFQKGKCVEALKQSDSQTRIRYDHVDFVKTELV